MRAAVVAIVSIGSTIACRAPEPAPTPAPTPVPEATPWSDAWLLQQAPAYLDDAGARRAGLEHSLTNPANMYSKLRLAAYGHGTRGWDGLPVWNPRSAPLVGEGLPAIPTTPLWDGKRPTTMADWVALGRRVFFEYPMRAEVFMEYALEKPELARAVGIERAADGSIPGLVAFANIDGETRVGITCAVCHAVVRDGKVVVGAAHRSFDYGRLRVAYDDENDIAQDPDQRGRMLRWGPGRADVTEDDDEDPVAIPDLWGLRAQRWLTQAGTIRHDSPFALAIRQETQLTDSNHQRVRPPRELAWALAMFVYSLAPAPSTAPAEPRGATIFASHCKTCHANNAYGGRTLAVSSIGTDPALATGRGRGTGVYRVPALLDVRDGAPYLHHGVVPTLADLLSPARLATIPGHPAGTDLDDADRAALIAYLQTL